MEVILCQRPERLVCSRCTGWHCPDKGFEYMGTAAESDYQAEPAAAECMPAPEVCRWKVCILYPSDGWLY